MNSEQRAEAADEMLNALLPRSGGTCCLLTPEFSGMERQRNVRWND